MKNRKMMFNSPNKDGSQGRGSYFASILIPLEIVKARREPVNSPLQHKGERLGVRAHELVALELRCGRFLAQKCRAFDVLLNS